MQDSLNDIRLTNAMLASLYGHSLILDQPLKKQQETISAPDQATLSFLGNHSKKVTVLVHHATHKYLPEDELAFLTKLLAACQLNAGDVAIVNLAKENLTLDNIYEQLAPVRILDFGTINGTAHFVTTTFQSAGLVSAPPIAELISDTPAAKELKARLWAALKQLFAIN